MSNESNDVVHVSLRMPRKGKTLLEEAAEGRYQTLSNFHRMALLKGLRSLEVDVDEQHLFPGHR